jgi:hypothetical protein
MTVPPPLLPPEKAPPTVPEMVAPDIVIVTPVRVPELGLNWSKFILSLDGPADEMLYVCCRLAMAGPAPASARIAARVDAHTDLPIAQSPQVGIRPLWRLDLTEHLFSPSGFNHVALKSDVPS